MPPPISDPDGPQRCTSYDNRAGDRCKYLAMPGFDKCAACGQKVAAIHNRKLIRGYKLALDQKRLDDLTNRSDAKSLVEEVGIIMQCIQVILDICDSNDKLIQYTPQLLTMSRMSEAMKVSLHRLELQSITLLDKSILFDMIEQTIALILPIMKEGSTMSEEEHGLMALNLTDDLLTIVSNHIGAGNKIPARSNDVVGFNPKYRIKHWEIQLKQFYSNPKLTDLRSELGLARIILEAHLAGCKTPAMLIHHFSQITSTLNLIRSLVISIQGIDLTTGNLLDRSDVITIADAIAKTLAKYLGDNQDRLTTVSEALANVFESIIPGQVDDGAGEKLSQDMLTLGGDLPENEW